MTLYQVRFRRGKGQPIEGMYVYTKTMKGAHEAIAVKFQLQDMILVSVSEIKIPLLILSNQTCPCEEIESIEDAPDEEQYVLSFAQFDKDGE